MKDPWKKSQIPSSRSKTARARADTRLRWRWSSIVGSYRSGAAGKLPRAVFENWLFGSFFQLHLEKTSIVNAPQKRGTKRRVAPHNSLTHGDMR